MAGKPWYLSKTVFVNALTAIATVMAQMADVLPPEWAPKIVTALAVVNLILRVVTTQPITK